MGEVWPSQSLNRTAILGGSNADEERAGEAFADEDRCPLSTGAK